MGYRLGVDLGTTFTAAAVTGDRGADVLALGNRALQVPSVVYVTEDGAVLVGEAAERRGAGDPTRLVREFKRRLGDSVPLIVGGAPFSPQSLLAQLLRWVVGVATERQGGPPDSVTVTHPANWGAFKRDLLRQAAVLADVGDAALCSEPEAAAIAYASRNRVAAGERVAVYDLGGGTFDAAVLRRDPDGSFGLVGSPEGIEHLGGVDFDEAVFRHVLDALGNGAGSLLTSDLPSVTALARLRRDCVEAKEALSADTETTIPVNLPGVTTTVRLTRGEFEDMVRPAIGETVSAMRRVLRSANLEPEDLSAIVLVGGSSRIPLVSELLSAEFGRPIALDTHPKHDVALGAALREAGVAGVAAPAPGAASAAASAPAPSAAPGPAAGPVTEPVPPPATTIPTPPSIPAPPPSVAAPVVEAPTVAAASVAGPPSATPRSEAPPATAPPAGPPGRWEPPAVVRPRGQLTDGDLPSGPPPAPGGDGSRRRAVVLGGAGLAVAAVVATVAIIVSGGDPPSDGGTQGTTTPTVTTSASASETGSAAFRALPRSPAPLADEFIVWATDRNGNRDLQAVSTIDGTRRWLTSSPDNDLFALVSLDRKTVMYEHERTEKAHDLHVVGADGSGDRPLFAGGPPEGCENVTRPGWSRDGEFLALPCVGVGLQRRLVLTRIDGTAVRDLDQGALSDPAFTRDGSAVVYWKNQGLDDRTGGALYLAPVDGSSPPVAITPVGTDRDNDPATSPVADRVAFRRVGAESGIWTAGLPEGAAPERLTENQADHDPAWSPDGRRMVFIREDHLWLMNSDGSGERQLTPDAAQITAPAWSTR